MSAVAYDALKLSKALEAAGFTPAARAEGLTKALAQSAQDSFATKQDFIRLEASAASQIASLKVALVKWIAAAIAFNFIGTAGLVIALV